MAAIAWTGPPPSRDVLARLKSAGLTIDRDDTDGLPLVVSTASAERVPAPHLPRGRWIWLSARLVPEARACDAVLRGAYEVLSPAATGVDVAALLVTRLQEMLTPEPATPEAAHVVQTSEAAQAVVRQAARVARTSMPVLLTGETGTGKEVTARLIHEWSPRRTKRFVPINCGAIPNDLMEAELFGYARGAFSGAVQRYDGQLLAAAGGTVFLDEIDDTPLELQTKLLRVLEDRVVSRLGENAWHEVDFRLLAATNRDLTRLIDAGLFGADLYERLAIVTIQLLPLRQRLEDLPPLALHFIRRFAREEKRPEIAGIAPDALAALIAYPWPGNVRELRNVIYETLVYKKSGS